jgi:hypothetical protein
MNRLGRGLVGGVPLVSILLCVACVVDNPPEAQKRAPLHDGGADIKSGDIDRPSAPVREAGVPHVREAGVPRVREAGAPRVRDASALGVVDTASGALLDASEAQLTSPPVDETSPDGEEPDSEETACDLLPSDLCDNVDEQSFVVSARNALPGITRVISISDRTSEGCESPTVHCLEETYPGLRFFGRAAVAMSDYACWGAGIVLNLVPEDDAGARSESFDAASLGIIGFRVNVGGVEGSSPIRLSLTQTDLPEDVTFVHAKGNKDVSEDGLLVFKFSDFAIPEWTAHLELEDVPLDASKLGSLLIEVPTSQEARPFFFELGEFEWLNQAMEPVPVPTL